MPNVRSGVCVAQQGPGPLSYDLGYRVKGRPVVNQIMTFYNSGFSCR